jgi:hypothetical protein
MTEFLAALGGALVGAMMVFVAELWRQVLAGKTAARLIYVESHNNGLMCDWAIEGQHYHPLTDAEWRTHSVHVVPLLTADASKLVAITFLAVPVNQQRIEELLNVPNGPTAQEARDSLAVHSRDFRKVALWMHQIEKKTRFKLLVELLIDRPMLPSEMEIDRALDMEP